MWTCFKDCSCKLRKKLFNESVVKNLGIVQTFLSGVSANLRLERLLCSGKRNVFYEKVLYSVTFFRNERIYKCRILCKQKFCIRILFFI